MQIIEVLQRIMSLYNKGVQSDDSRLRYPHIYNKALSVRAKLLSQKSRKGQNLSDWDYTTIHCIDMIPAHFSECPVNLGDKKVLRSRNKIPRPIADISKNLIKSVTSLDGAVVFEESSFEHHKYSSGNKFAKKHHDYIFYSGYLFIISSNFPFPKTVTMTYVVEDPIEAYNYKGSCNEGEEDCTPVYELEFPLEAGMIDTLVEISTNELINMFSQTIEDRSNNSSDSSAEQSK